MNEGISDDRPRGVDDVETDEPCACCAGTIAWDGEYSDCGCPLDAPPCPPAVGV